MMMMQGQGQGQAPMMQGQMPMMMPQTMQPQAFNMMQPQPQVFTTPATATWYGATTPTISGARGSQNGQS